MAALALQRPGITGLAPAYAAAGAAGDTFPADPHAIVHVKNNSGASINVTVDSKTLCNQGTDHDLVIAVPAGGERMIGGLTLGRFADSAGNGSVTYSAVTSVLVAIIAS